MTVLWTPPLELRARAGKCRLSMAGLTYGNGDTMQEAANDLLVRLYDLALALRHGSLRFTSETGRPDEQVLGFLWELGEIAARGGDLRGRVFGDGIGSW